MFSVPHRPGAPAAPATAPCRRDPYRARAGRARTILCLAALSALGATPLPAASAVRVADLADALHLAVRGEDLTHRLILQAGDQRVVLCPGLGRAVVNGRVVILDSPPCFASGHLTVPGSFMDLLKRELYGPGRKRPTSGPDRSRAAWRAPRVKIVLDPGHGGRDPGAVRRGVLYEKTINLDVARRLQSLLLAAGYQVVMTRNADVALSLQQRCDRANRAAPDLFMSIHANAGPPSAHGYETFFVDASAKAVNWGLRALVGSFSSADYGSACDDPLLRPILTRALYDDYRMQSRFFAQCVQWGLARYLNTPNRGARPHKLYVLRGVSCPRVLVEVGFVSNPRTGPRLNRAAHRQRIAQGLADGVRRFTQAQLRWRQIAAK